MFRRIVFQMTSLLLLLSSDARDITFASALDIKGLQKPTVKDDGIDITTDSEFSGLMTFANLPYANCFTDSHMDAYDIAILGAPFDTVSTVPFAFFPSWYASAIFVLSMRCPCIPIFSP